MVTGIVIAAAGQGKRFIQAGGAGNKLNASLGEVTVFEQTLQHALASYLPVHVVTRPENSLLQQVCTEYHVTFTLLESRGLGDSIAAGVNATKEWDGWLIHLADMPFVTPQIFIQTAAALRQHAIARPCFNQQPGHPVGFSAALRGPLCALQGDDGGSSVLHGRSVYLFPIYLAAMVQDIDLPSQLPASE